MTTLTRNAKASVAGGSAQSKDDAPKDNTDHAPFAVLIPTRKARKVVWRRFASYAGALAEARHLRSKGVAATVEEAL